MLSGVLGFQIQPWGRMGWITNYIFHSNILGNLYQFLIFSWYFSVIQVKELKLMLTSTGKWGMGTG